MSSPRPSVSSFGVAKKRPSAPHATVISPSGKPTVADPGASGGRARGWKGGRVPLRGDGRSCCACCAMSARRAVQCGPFEHPRALLKWARAMRSSNARRGKMEDHAPTVACWRRPHTWTEQLNTSDADTGAAAVELATSLPLCTCAVMRGAAGSKRTPTVGENSCVSRRHCWHMRRHLAPL